MDTTKTGGPAFPSTTKTYTADNGDTMHQGANGMTLRDWFAATVDIPWSAVLATLELKGEKNVTAGRLVEYRARLRYLEADAMLRAREA